MGRTLTEFEKTVMAEAWDSAPGDQAELALREALVACACDITHELGEEDATRRAMVRTVRDFLGQAGAERDALRLVADATFSLVNRMLFSAVRPHLATGVTEPFEATCGALERLAQVVGLGAPRVGKEGSDAWYERFGQPGPRLGSIARQLIERERALCQSVVLARIADVERKLAASTHPIDQTAYRYARDMLDRAAREIAARSVDAPAEPRENEAAYYPNGWRPEPENTLADRLTSDELVALRRLATEGCGGDLPRSVATQLAKLLDEVESSRSRDEAPEDPRVVGELNEARAMARGESPYENPDDE